MGGGRGQVIELRLNSAEEMFALAQTDLFSEYRNYRTGVEYCISLLRSQRLRAPVRLELSLPPSELDQGLGDRLSAALRRYCDQRISYNERERRAVRLAGVRSLWVGVPIVVLGYLLAIFAGRLVALPATPTSYSTPRGGCWCGWESGSRSTRSFSVRLGTGTRTASSSFCATPRSR